MRKTIFLSLLMIAAFCSCQSVGSMFQEPKVSLNSIDIAGVTLSGVDLIANVGVQNLNSFPIPMPKVAWELFVNGNPFVDGILEENKSIGSRETVSFNIPMSVSYERFLGSVSSILGILGAGSTGIPYNVDMGLTFPIPLLENKVYKLDHSGFLPLPRL